MNNKNTSLNLWENGIEQLNAHHHSKTYVGLHDATHIRTKEMLVQSWSALEPHQRNRSTYDFEDVVYRFNSLGFRSDEFVKRTNDPTPTVLFSGCSFTEGFGVPDEHMWTRQFLNLAEGLVGKSPAHYNLGSSGWGIDRMVRAIHLLVHDCKFCPDYLLVLVPPINREELCVEDFNPKEYPGIYSSYNTGRNAIESVFVKQRNNCLRTRNLIIKLQQQMLLLHYICTTYNIKYLWGYWDDMTQLTEAWDITDFLPSYVVDKYVSNAKILDETIIENMPVFLQQVALDKLHPGPTNHYRFAHHFWEKLQNVYI